MLHTLRFQGDTSSTDNHLTAPRPKGEAARKTLIELRRALAERYPDLLENASPYNNRLPSTSLPQEEHLPLIQEDPETQLPHITLTTAEGEEQAAVIRYPNLYTPLLSDQFRPHGRPKSHDSNTTRQTGKSLLGVLGGMAMSLTGTALMIRSSEAKHPNPESSDFSPLGMTLTMTGFLVSIAAMASQILKDDREEPAVSRRRRIDSRV